MKTYSRGANAQISTNFNSREFNCKCGKCKTTLIDTQLVNYLQLIRNHFGKPITINSGYRCADHNKAVGGASKSRHTLGQAADIVVVGVEPKEVAKYAESIGVKGIGLYDSFTHVDTRATKSFWLGHEQKPVASFGGAPNNPTNSEVTVSLPTLQRGSRGKYVGVLQALLGIAVDNEFGKNTEAAVKALQKKHGLSTDGIAGAKTWGAAFK